MGKIELDYMRPQSARGYRYLAVPKELLENSAFSGLDYGAVILYAKMLERASLSARHEDSFTDENGRLFIIYTVEQMEKDIQRSHPTVIKFTKQLAEIGLIEKVRQGQGRPTKIYIKDFTSAIVDEPVPSMAGKIYTQEVQDFNGSKSEYLSSCSKENELLDVKNLSCKELNNKELENKGLILPTDIPKDEGCEVKEMTEDDVEELQADVRSQIEYTVLCENYDEDLADEIVEIITEVLCRDGPEMKIGGTIIPTALVRKRMRSLTYEHVSYVLDNLGKAGPVHNPHRYLLAVLFNAPASCRTSTQAIFNATN